LNRETGKIVTLDTLEVAPNLRHLYAHLIENHFVEDIRNFNADYLPITTNGVIKKLQAGDATWENQVPVAVAQVIKAKKLFGGK
jgi:hypothetical protein